MSSDVIELHGSDVPNIEEIASATQPLEFLAFETVDHHFGFGSTDPFLGEGGKWIVPSCPEQHLCNRSEPRLRWDMLASYRHASLE